MEPASPLPGNRGGDAESWLLASLATLQREKSELAQRNATLARDVAALKARCELLESAAADTAALADSLDAAEELAGRQQAAAACARANCQAAEARAAACEAAAASTEAELVGALTVTRMELATLRFEHESMVLATRKRTGALSRLLDAHQRGEQLHAAAAAAAASAARVALLEVQLAESERGRLKLSVECAARRDALQALQAVQLAGEPCAAQLASACAPSPRERRPLADCNA
jgi:hypothetical protein